MIRLTTATVVVNNEPVGVVSGSVSLVEGDGEFSVSAVSVGANVEQVFSEDLDSAFAVVKFQIPNTVENMKLTRQWKRLKNTNYVQIAASNADGKFDRTVSQAAMLNDPEKTFGKDTDIDIEFQGNTAI